MPTEVSYSLACLGCKYFDSPPRCPLVIPPNGLGRLNSYKCIKEPKIRIPLFACNPLFDCSIRYSWNVFPSLTRPSTMGFDLLSYLLPKRKGAAQPKTTAPPNRKRSRARDHGGGHLPTYIVPVLLRFPCACTTAMTALKIWRVLTPHLRPPKSVSSSASSTFSSYATTAPVSPTLPLAGVRVLDMTRVLAGVRGSPGNGKMGANMWEALLHAITGRPGVSMMNVGHNPSAGRGKTQGDSKLNG